MLKLLLRSLALVALLCSAAVRAAPVPAGYVSWDVNIPASVGNFNISNLTGVNVLDPDFPITTPLTLSSLSLTVDFEGGGQTVFGSSYFTLGPDGLSLNGGDIAIGGSNPLPVSALLTGSFGTTSIALTDSSTMTIFSTFSASIVGASATLQDGDLAVIYATQNRGGGPVPEPATLVLVITVVAGMSLSRRARRPGAGTGHLVA